MTIRPRYLGNSSGGAGALPSTAAPSGVPPAPPTGPPAAPPAPSPASTAVPDPPPQAVKTIRQPRPLRQDQAGVLTNCSTARTANRLVGSLSGDRPKNRGGRERPAGRSARRRQTTGPVCSLVAGGLADLGPLRHHLGDARPTVAILSGQGLQGLRHL